MPTAIAAGIFWTAGLFDISICNAIVDLRKEIWTCHEYRLTNSWGVHYNAEYGKAFERVWRKAIGPDDGSQLQFGIAMRGSAFFMTFEGEYKNENE